MLARYTLNVHNTPTEDGEQLVRLGGELNLTTRASASGASKDTLVLEVIADFEPPDRVKSVFSDLANDILPSDAKPYETLGFRVEPGQSLNRHVPAPNVLPEAFQEFSRMLRAELSNAARRVYKLYRWRTDSYVTDRRGFSSQGFRYSLDGELWFHLPAPGSVRTSAVGHVNFRNGLFEAAVQPMLDLAVDEPLGFELLSEAAELSSTSRRGALVVAVAALEVGVKSFIGALVPKAEWLVMHLPSPPVKRLLVEYLPGLPVVTRLPSGAVRPPPDGTLEVIRDAVERRNGITHRGGETTIEFVDETIQAVSDTLRLLDYYAGHSWATDYMSYEFAVVLGLRERDEESDAFLDRKS